MQRLCQRESKIFLPNTYRIFLYIFNQGSLPYRSSGLQGSVESCTVVESTHTVVIGHSKMVGCRALLLLALSLLLQVVVGYWSRFSCVENRYLVVLRARASKKKELDSSGAATGSNDSNGEYNDLNFATQLQQLISGTVVEKAQSNNGRNSQSEIGN